ncbi:MAG: hypothetical protein NVS1B10_08710 [Candidatus Saccharimonadales bacterium]
MATTINPTVNGPTELLRNQIPPIADIGLLITRDSLTNNIVIDFALTQNNDAVLIHGADRFIQDITRWFITPLGANPFDPSYGNPNYKDVLGLPSAESVNHKIVAAIRVCEGYFRTRQQHAKLAGTIFSGEEFIGFENVQVSHKDGTAVASFIIHFRIGKKATATVVF